MADSFRLNPAIMADSYKATHYLQYPAAQLMVAYAEFRPPFNRDASDTRLVWYGLRYVVEHHIQRRWTVEDVDDAAHFYATHNAAHSPMPFPRDLFLRFIREHGGWFPVRIEALPEGTVAHVHTPVFQIYALDEYAQLVTFLETLLTQVWYGTTVATLSRRTKAAVAKAFDRSVDDSRRAVLDHMLHDFGMRGCTSVEQGIIGGCAHLLSFRGSDTMTAGYYAQKRLNGGRPVSESIPASEHSVMTAWPDERQAFERMIEQFGGEGCMFSIVADSYDYVHALTHLLPAVAALHTRRGGMMIIRPDSGDPVECVLQALRAGEKVFGVDVNGKGYKVLRSMGVIQGDGINYDVVVKLCEAVMEAGFSVQSVAFGMGGGLLQKVNRDTMSFATKLSYLIDADGHERNVMKRPKHEGAKTSLPGIMRVVAAEQKGALTVVPARWNRETKQSEGEGVSVMRLVWDYGPVEGCWDDFDVLRERVERQWVEAPPVHDVVSAALKDSVERWVQGFSKREDRPLGDGVTQ